MREADWTPHPATEREIADEWRSRAMRRWLGCGLTGAILGACPLSCLSLAYSPRYHGFHFIIAFALLAASLGLGAAYLLKSVKSQALRFRRLTRLAADRADADGWVVDFALYQGATPTGYDCGVVWFEDEQLYFVGERTSFGFAAGLASSEVRQDTTGSSLRSEMAFAIRRRSPVGEVSVGFSLVDATGGTWPQRSAESLLGSLKVWLGKATVSSEGQIPPLTIGPRVPSSGRLFRRAIGISIVWAALGLTLISLCIVSEWPVVPFFAVLVFIVSLFWGDLWTPCLHWRAWADRRRLDRSLRQDRDR